MEKKISVHCDSEGRTNQLCPYARNEFGVVIMGDYQCRRCEYYRGKDETTRTISCSHPAGHTIKVYATDEELRERWRHINLLKIEADTMFDEEDNVNGVKVWSVSQAKEILKEILSMENKTKKMTKAEAFEYLKGKRIKCICAVAYEDAQANKVERFLKDVGCKYHFANHISWRDWYWPLYGFIVDKNGEIYVTFEDQMHFFEQSFNEPISADDILSIEIVDEKKDDERKGEILDEIAKLGEKISDLIEEYEGDIIIEIDQYEVLLRNSGDILYRK